MFTYWFYTVIGIVQLKNTCNSKHKKVKHQVTTVSKKKRVCEITRCMLTHSLGTSHLSPKHNEPNPVRWTTGHTLIWTDKTLRLYGLNYRKFPLFLPAQAPCHHPHTQSWDTSPFTEAQRTQPSPLDHRTHHYMTPICTDKTLRLYGLN